MKLEQIAYHAYGDSVSWKNYQGNPMPKWEDLTPAIQNAWRAAVTAVNANWRNELDERQLKEVRLAEHYAENYSHGTSGHLGYMTLAKLASLLDKS